MTVQRMGRPFTAPTYLHLGNHRVFVDLEMQVVAQALCLPRWHSCRRKLTHVRRLYA